MEASSPGLLYVWSSAELACVFPYHIGTCVFCISNNCISNNKNHPIFNKINNIYGPIIKTNINSQWFSMGKQFVILCLKLISIHKLCHIRYKGIEVIRKVVSFVLCNALTHCRLNRLSHTIYYILEESNFNFRCVRLWDLDIPREKWLNYLQTMETLIRPQFCSVWSGSALFANYPFRGLQATMG